MKIYLDHNSTTPPHPEVLARVHEWLAAWGNPSSVHFAGREPKRLLREAREAVARFLNIDPFEVIFTSGGSESNSLALRGAFEAIVQNQPERKKLVLSNIEHPAVLETATQLAELGAQIAYIPVSRGGILDLATAAKLIDDQTALVSVMLANNETGSILPVKDLAHIAHDKGALIHSDCVQALGKIPINLRALGVDLASFSAHKFYALRGCGVLYQRRGTPLTPQIRGGGHERRRRAGTENMLAIAALAHVCQISQEELQSQNDQMQTLRDEFETAVRESVPGTTITGNEVARLPNTSNIVVPEVPGETLLMSLDLKGFAVSSGSACSSGSAEPSRTLTAMGLSRSEADRSLRVSLGHSTTREQILEFIAALKSVVSTVETVHRKPGVHVGT